MFQKPFNVKSQTVLKGSERKKVRASINSQCPLFTTEILSEIIPQKSDVQLAKVALHSGDNASIILSDKQPVFFELNGNYFPSVYTAWKYPDAISTLSTWGPVISKLFGGADLMLPGVVTKGTMTADTLSHIHKGLAVGVSAVGNRSALAIGDTCMSGREMYEAGMRGKGVYIRHYYGDQLWAMGSKVAPPSIPEPLVANEAGEDGHTDGTPGMDIQALTLQDAAVSNEINASEDQDSSSKDVGIGNEDENASEVADVSFNDLSEDDKLKQCFLYAIKKKLKKTQLPLLTSTFFRDCIVTCCPSGASIDLKKTSYKKLMPFLTQMQKEGLVVIKETSKGCHSIVDFDPSHPEIRAFKTWDLEVEDTTPDDTQEYRYEPPEIVELLAVNAQTLPLFSRLGMNKGTTMDLSEMRKLAIDYVKNQKLQHETDKSLVVLDEVLTQVLVTKKDGYVENLKWNQVMERLANALGNVYEMRFPTGSVISKKGHPSPIEVKLETRTGNKKVTLIRNLDKFGIDVKMIAKDLRSTKACSTTIQEHATGPQVLAQGNHASFLNKLLKEKYRIPIKYLDIPT